MKGKGDTVTPVVIQLSKLAPASFAKLQNHNGLYDSSGKAQ